MTSYPINTQVTNFKINSEQDLFEIDPSFASNNSGDNCEPVNCIEYNLLPLIQPCNRILAALKVKGSVAICKGLNIGETNAEIQGTIRYNRSLGRFEGYNSSGWSLLDCCGIPDGHLDTGVLSNICNGEDHIYILPDSDLSTNASISIGPKGTGFISAQQPTPGSATGGDCRGQNAVDWQQVRNDSNQVASGNQSFIGGGANNEVNGTNSVIVGGSTNLSNADYSFIGGGNNNTTNSQYDVICGGNNNTTNNDGSFIGGGNNNTTTGENSVIVGGTTNTSSGDITFIGGGELNKIYGGNNDPDRNSDYTFIGGGYYNIINSVGKYCAITGGYYNRLEGINSIITGGYNNEVGEENVFVGGGVQNQVFGNTSSVVGGKNNIINSDYSFIGGGNNNTTNSQYDVICGGNNNTTNNDGSFIGGGNNNTTNSDDSFIGGGYNNNIGTNANYSNIIGGYTNNIRDDNGGYSLIGGGSNNEIQEKCSLCAILSGNMNIIASNGILLSDSCFISGGSTNLITNGGYSSGICGGIQNTIEQATNFTTIGKNHISGGQLNTIRSVNSAIVGGYNCSIGQFDLNNASYYNFIGGGHTNKINGNYCGIISGNNNSLEGNQYSSICGGINNKNYANLSVIAGGSGHNVSATSTNSIIGGGHYHSLDNAGYSGIISGYSNSITSSSNNFIGGGTNNIISNGSNNSIIGGNGLKISATNLSVKAVTVCGQFNNETTNATSDAVTSGLTSVPTTRVFTVGGGTSDMIRENLFSIDISGNVYAKGSYASGGADFAEYFESIYTYKIPIGTTVTFDKEQTDKIKICEKDEVPIGVISATPNMLGNAYEDEWQGKYEKNEFGQFIYDNKQRKIVSKKYDPNQKYISRKDRPEWNVVGLVGQVHIKKGQITAPNWKKMRQVSDNVDLWLIR